MDQNFQTSFIPKKPMIEKTAISREPIGLFTIVAIFIFFIVVIITLGLYFYNGYLERNIVQMENDLNLAQNRFEPSKVLQLQVLDKRLRAASQILSKHVTISPIFQALQALTMKTVSYNKFDYELNNGKNSKILVKMSGTALGYQSIALQSDLFSKNKNLIDPVFSNLSLDDKGNVLFDLDFSVDPTFVDYKNMLKTKNENLSGILNNGQTIN